MISVDTNLLLYAQVAQCPFHQVTRSFLEEIGHATEVALSEFVLAELYVLLRNAAVVDNPLNGRDTVMVIDRYRRHPRWRIVGFTDNSRELHDRLWQIAAGESFSRRRIYDARLALTLRRHGVRDFATTNVKDFEGFGFRRVWNPLE